MAVYDPSLDVTEALNLGFTRMTLINANSISSVNLNLAYRQKPSGVFAYDYTSNCSFPSPSRQTSSPFKVIKLTSC